jgi:thymidylate kinase
MGVMTKRINKTLPGPNINEVKIWFQGATGSGKTLLSNFIQEALEAQGLKVQTYCFGGADWVPEENQIVDLTRQDITDVLTVKLDRGQDLAKLYMRRVVAV